MYTQINPLQNFKKFHYSNGEILLQIKQFMKFNFCISHLLPQTPPCFSIKLMPYLLSILSNVQTFNTYIYMETNRNSLTPSFHLAFYLFHTLHMWLVNHVCLFFMFKIFKFFSTRLYLHNKISPHKNIMLEITLMTFSYFQLQPSLLAQY